MCISDKIILLLATIDNIACFTLRSPCLSMFQHIHHGEPLFCNCFLKSSPALAAFFRHSAFAVHIQQLYSGGCRIYWRGLYYSIARAARAKNLSSRPLRRKPRPFPSVFERSFLSYLVNPFIFDRDLCQGMLRWAMHRSWFRSSLPRQGGSS